MEKETGDFNAILTLLYQRTGHDFRGYRPSTLQRRIDRRLHATGCPTGSRYLEFLTNHQEEEPKLIRDLTIRVTEFFRDPESFKAVQEKVLPALIERGQKSEIGSQTLKVWSAGCATGEETYSLAILFEEAHRQVSILGTDLDQEALRSAREGIYTEEKLKLVPQPLREIYFKPVNNGYQLIQKMRDCVDFRDVDLVTEEPPGAFDLVSCRNVLIYFSKELQERVLLKFHEALKPGGLLWLGKAESLWGRGQELFECLDKNSKIFRRQL